MAILELLTTVFTPTWQSVYMSMIVVLVAVFYQYWKNRHLPPGPYGLPIVGYGPFLSTARAGDLGKLCRKYNTDILSINIYNRLFIVINSLELTKEVFQKRSDVADRLDDASFSRLDPGYGGIIGSNGQFWRDHRRFAISMLRDFGMGRIAAEKMIQQENEQLMEVFRSHKGRPFDPKSAINKAVSNVICAITFGKRFDYSDERFNHALDSMNRIMGRGSAQDHVTLFSKMLIDYFIPSFVAKFIFRDLIKIIFGSYEGFSSFCREEVASHRTTYDGNVTDLIYGYYKEMEKRENDEDSYFNERQAACLVTDLFVAGSETTFSSLRWALLYMAAYPEIQEKVHEELVEVIGEHRAPTMGDKKMTPYTEAVLSEIQRYATLVQLGVLHSNVNEDIVINDYVIPEGTPVAANLHAMHHDERTWKNPNEFDPNNFLEDGKVVNLEKLVQFSVDRNVVQITIPTGKRACAGEALARMELYVFFATWTKDFKIQLATDDAVPDLKGYYGGVFMPTQFDVRLTERFER